MVRLGCSLECCLGARSHFSMASLGRAFNQPHDLNFLFSLAQGRATSVLYGQPGACELTSEFFYHHRSMTSNSLLSERTTSVLYGQSGWGVQSILNLFCRYCSQGGTTLLFYGSLGTTAP